MVAQHLPGHFGRYGGHDRYVISNQASTKRHIALLAAGHAGKRQSSLNAPRHDDSEAVRGQADASVARIASSEAPQNGVLVYETGGQSDDVQLTWYDRMGNQISTVGAPGEWRGIALSPDGSRLFVANRLDDTVSVIDTGQAKVVGTIALGSPAIIDPRRSGERLFYSSKFSFQGQFGCANCHLDSTFDGLQWDLEPDGFGVDIVDNRAIEDVANTAPFKWNGGNPDLYTECGPRTALLLPLAGISRCRPGRSHHVHCFHSAAAQPLPAVQRRIDSGAGARQSDLRAQPTQGRQAHTRE